MSEPFVFDPRCSSCKTPFGAVACGGQITLHVRPLLQEGFSHCALVLRLEFSQEILEYPLSPDGQDGDRARFSLTFPAPAAPELAWYHFRLWREDGSGCVLDKTGYRSDNERSEWQLTVYDAAHSVPAWFGQGVTYQIFPDRFHRLTVPKADGMVGERLVHENWADTPQWQPDEQGEVRNRDFFGGSLQGIVAKLSHLAALGVTTLYLNPIFESDSNHRYNTADYTHIDPMLGTEADFTDLCRQAGALGIRVILDGVFNHTGSNSVYFNANGFYPTPGASQSPASPYFSWYTFHPWPEDYDAWWGIRTLPAVNEDDPDYGRFIIENQDSVIRRWLRAGASGWRLDVADELPDPFIARIRKTVEETDPDAILIGEVWEDGSNKIAYSQRRKYLLGGELHGLMNYPFRTAALAYLKGGDAAAFQDAMETIRENYPAPAFYSAMNFLGTHDTPRILTLLGDDAPPAEKKDRAQARLSPAQRADGLALLHVAAALLFAFPGSPTIYYGDEAGMEGFEDPFNRRGYPWGREEASLLAHYQRLGQLRRQRPSLQHGDLVYLHAAGPLLAFSRTAGAETTLAVFNAGETEASLSLPWAPATASDGLTHQPLPVADGQVGLCLPPRSAMLVL